MRTTNNMLINNMMYYMNNNLDRMSKLQTQMATGKKINVASDDPVVAARALKFRTDVSEVEQFKKNSEDAQSWLDTTESAMTNVNDVLQELYWRAVQVANGTMTGDDRDKAKMEVEQFKYQLVHLANTSYAGRYVFSGHSTDSKLLNEDGSYNVSVSSSETALIKGSSLSFPITISAGINDEFSIGVNSTDPLANITIPAGTYPDLASLDTLAASIKLTVGFPTEIAVTAESGRLQFSLNDTTDGVGNKQAIYLKSGVPDALQTIGFKTDAAGNLVSKSEDMNYLVSIGDQLNVNVPGTALFGTGIKGETGDFMQKVNAFVTALASNDTTGLQQAIGNMDVLLDKSLSIQADIGARTNRVELTLNRLETDEVNFTELMSNNEDVDMAEVIMNLSNEENVYRSSLAAGAKIIMPTLLDFLR